ncbi:hypothetical protein WDU94_008737 [Cyamophila willieti]
MNFLVFSLTFLTWSSTLTLITCLPLHIQTGSDTPDQNGTTVELEDNLVIEQQTCANNQGILQQNGDLNASKNADEISDCKDTLGKTGFESIHNLLNRKEIPDEVKNDNEDEDFGRNQHQSRILDGLDKILGPRKRREIRRPVPKDRNDIVEKINGDSYIREETSILLIIVAVLLCLLCIYYYCSCCIFMYYLKSQFCFDIDLYKKPEAVCPPKNTCDRKYSC